MKEIVIAVYVCCGTFHIKETNKDIDYKTTCILVGHFDDKNRCNYITTHKGTCNITEDVIGKDLKDALYNRYGRIVSFK